MMLLQLEKHPQRMLSAGVRDRQTCTVYWPHV
jgi:hypothetical protein